MTPRTHRIPVKNFMGPKGTHDLAFYDWGDENAEEIVFCVHGLTRNARDFDALAIALAARGKRVFALDMAGRGQSAWLADPVDYNYASYAADCLAVMDNFHLRGVDWVGTSMGGIIGMMIAAGHPTRIRKLVLNDIGTFLSKTALQRIYDYVRAMPTSFPSRAAATAYLKEIFKPFGITDEAVWAHFIDHSLHEEGGTIRLACDPAIATPLALASDNFTKVDDVNLSMLWEKIAIPVLILRGAESDILDAETVSAMRATNPKAEAVTIAGVGHAPALASTDQTSLIANWLGRASIIPAGL
jgi:pimeloyl-ACP methyl ester carboxylesterase